MLVPAPIGAPRLEAGLDAFGSEPAAAWVEKPQKTRVAGGGFSGLTVGLARVGGHVIIAHHLHPRAHVLKLQTDDGIQPSRKSSVQWAFGVTSSARLSIG